MAKQSINLGSSANDGGGTTLRAGGDIVNDNFSELYTALGDGTDLKISLGSPSTGDVLAWNGSIFTKSTPSTLANIVEDTTPQLGGNLDTNSHNILIDDAHFIADENSNEQIIFQTTSSAVNQIDVTNAATGNAPSIQATGDDSNIDLKVGPKGTGNIQLHTLPLEQTSMSH